MKAVRAGGDGKVSVVEMPVPGIGPGEALMRTRAAGICGSDLLTWYAAKKAGSVLGHEVAGEIVEAGEGVTRFAPGDRVVPHHHAPCLECAACRAGRYVHCGEWRSSNLDPGGMAEFVRIPAGNLARDTRKVPAGLSDQEASFAEPLATVVKAFRRGRFEAGQTVLIVGLGSMGQLAARLARARGAGFIAGADRVASRLEFARGSGVEETINVEGEGLSEGARRISGGKGFNFVFVGPGKGGVILESFETAAAGGALLLFTMAAPEERLTLSPHDLYFREINLIPSYSCGPDDMSAAIELLATGAVAVADLVTHRFPIERAAEAFARAAEPEGSLKVMMTFP